MRQVNGGAPGAEPRTVLVVSATHRDHRELKRLYPSGVDFRFHDLGSTPTEELIAGARDDACAGDPHVEVERILASVEGTAIGAVVSSDDYPGSALAAIIAKRLGLPGPDPASS